MIYAKLDINYPDHPKIAALSDAAFRAHVEMILYCRRFLTDGRIANRIANRFANRFGFEVLTELLHNDPDSPSLTELPDGDYQLHDFVEIQGSRSDVESRAQVNRANGNKGGRPRKTESVSESVTESVGESGGETKPKPNPRREKREEVVEVPNGTSLPRRRGCRLPDDWKPDEDDRRYAVERGLNPDSEAENFRDYWHNKPGKDGLKLEWSLAWRTWIRRSAERPNRLKAVPDPWTPAAGSPLSYVEM